MKYIDIYYRIFEPRQNNLWWIQRKIVYIGRTEDCTDQFTTINTFKLHYNCCIYYTIVWVISKYGWSSSNSILHADPLWYTHLYAYIYVCNVYCIRNTLIILIIYSNMKWIIEFNIRNLDLTRQSLLQYCTLVGIALFEATAIATTKL